MYNSLSSFLESIGYPTANDQFVIHNLQDVSPEPPFKSDVFRANYFTFVLVKTGDTRYTLDGVEYVVRDRTLYFTNPGHMKSFELLKPVDGKLISFSLNFLDDYVERDPFSRFPYLLSEVVPPLYLGPEGFDELWSLASLMQREASYHSEEVRLIIGSYFRVFLLKVNQNIQDDELVNREMDRDSEILKTFKMDLENNIRDLLQGRSDQLMRVTTFAERQYLHPTYFSTVIKNKTGNSAQFHINERIILEAKSMLKQSSSNIKEIAHQLGFTDSNYFSKFFKKQEGLSPGSYRKKAR